MSTSLAPVEPHLDAIKRAAAGLLSAPLNSLKEVGGGRNSRVYRLDVEDQEPYALKVYFRDVSETRARMKTEFGSLQFLWEQGVRSIPKPVVASQEHGFAVYSWIEGERITVPEIRPHCIHAASDFLCQLAELRHRPETEHLPPASEACFSGSAILDNLERRLRPLRACSGSPELQSFLVSRLEPSLKRMSDWSRRQIPEVFEQELDLTKRTLSPSDFGFHNALQNRSGQIFFVDFEYFGWDDPAKTICDFLLHPAMPMAPSLRRQFAQSLVSGLHWSIGLRERVQAYYPLFGIKWCVILLNEFLPDQLLRRRFATGHYRDEPTRQMEQLAKAESMLDRTLSEYEHLPYLD